MSTIKILPKHFSPRWHAESYPVFRGNFNSASDMENVDLTSPSSMTQGKGTANLTAGTQAGAITTLLKGMTRTAVTANVAYGTGGALLQKFSATAVTNASPFPHTITGTGTITGEDVIYVKSKLYYSYNDSNTPSGDVGRYDLATTFVDSQFVTGLSGTALQNAPHQMTTGNGRIYITNGKYVAELDPVNATATHDALTLYENDVCVSMVWNNDRNYIAVNNPNLSGANTNQSFVYTWNGYDDNYDGDPIRVNGRISALYTKNSITFVFYENRIGSSSINVLGYIGENRVIPLVTFNGDLPEYWQVGERGDYLMFLSGNLLYLYGSLIEQSVGLEQFLTTPYATGGGIATPFGEIICSSSLSTNFSLAKESGYTVNSDWKSMVFPISDGKRLAQLSSIVVFTETMGANAKADFVLRYNSGGSSLNLDQIITGKTRHIIGARDLPKVEDFRIEVSFANGSTAHNTKIKRIEIDYDLINSK